MFEDGCAFYIRQCNTFEIAGFGLLLTYAVTLARLYVLKLTVGTCLCVETDSRHMFMCRKRE